jgi:hypothetical protein
MAQNIQTFPQAIYPINGDVESQSGDPDVTVVGIQGTPVLDQAPLNGQILIYDSPTNNYVPGDPIVSGPDPTGSTPSVNPVQVAGIDEGDLVRELRTDTYGSLRSLRIEQLLYLILLELRALKAATINLDDTMLSTDYEADNFTQLGEL